MATYLLVHGAWSGGWVWHKIVPRLRDAGHQVFAPTLTGLGERAHLGHARINLDTHIADILGVVEAEELDQIVLCGHSYGGAVITGVAQAAADRLAALVYVDAFVPESGESSFGRMGEAAAEAIRQAARDQGDGWRVPPRSSAIHKMIDPADAALYDRRVVGHPIGCMEQAITHTEPWRRVDSLTYIHATANAPSPFGAIAARLAEDPAWTLHELPCGHIVALDLPNELTEILLNI